MCFCASLLPTPREPECRNSHTRSASSSDTSMKWLPDPSEPSCSGQLRDARRRPARRRAVARSSSIRGSAVARTFWLWWPADSGIDREICPCSTARSRAGEVVGGELGADGHHPAADVHADRRRDDRALGRDDRADGRALAQVRVGHQRQVRVDERHRRGALGLLAGGVLQDRRPVEQACVDLLHGPFSSLGCGSGGAAQPVQSTRRPPRTATALLPRPCRARRFRRRIRGTDGGGSDRVHPRCPPAGRIPRNPMRTHPSSCHHRPDRWNLGPERDDRAVRRRLRRDDDRKPGRGHHDRRPRPQTGAGPGRHAEGGADRAGGSLLPAAWRRCRSRSPRWRTRRSSTAVACGSPRSAAAR